MTTVSIKPEIIRWAIDRSGLTLEELQSKFPKLGDWSSGSRQPTFNQLEQFARTTMTPFGMMFLDKPPVEDLLIPDFRTKRDAPLPRFSPNLLETIQTIQQRQAWMREWLTEEGAEPLDFVGSGSKFGNVKSLAQRMRERLELDAGWAELLPNWQDALTVLRRAIERSGVLVFSNGVVGLNNRRALDPDEFRGFVLCDPLAPVIFLNDADSKSARIFTLVHELAHVWIGQDGVFNLAHLLPSSNAAERFCNQVAAEFLVPAHKLEERWSQAAASDRPFHTLAKWFKVSPVVAARRALDMQLISMPEFFPFYEQDREDWSQRKAEERQKSSGGNFYATQSARLGRRFSSAVVRAAREGRLLFQEAFRLTGLKGRTFHAFADEVLNRVRDERE